MLLFKRFHEIECKALKYRLDCKSEIESVRSRMADVVNNELFGVQAECGRLEAEQNKTIRNMETFYEELQATVRQNTSIEISFIS